MGLQQFTTGYLSSPTMEGVVPSRTAALMAAEGASLAKQIEERSTKAEALAKAPAMAEAYTDAFTRLNQGDLSGFETLQRANSLAVGNPMLESMAKNANAEATKMANFTMESELKRNQEDDILYRQAMDDYRSQTFNLQNTHRENYSKWLQSEADAKRIAASQGKDYTPTAPPLMPQMPPEPTRSPYSSRSTSTTRRSRSLGFGGVLGNERVEPPLPGETPQGLPSSPVQPSIPAAGQPKPSQGAAPMPGINTADTFTPSEEGPIPGINARVDTSGDADALKLPVEARPMSTAQNEAANRVGAAQTANQAQVASAGTEGTAAAMASGVPPSVAGAVGEAAASSTANPPAAKPLMSKEAVSAAAKAYAASLAAGASPMIAAAAGQAAAEGVMAPAVATKAQSAADQAKAEAKQRKDANTEDIDIGYLNLKWQKQREPDVDSIDEHVGKTVLHKKVEPAPTKILREAGKEIAAEPGFARWVSDQKHENWRNEIVIRAEKDPNNSKAETQYIPYVVRPDKTEEAYGKVDANQKPTGAKQPVNKSLKEAWDKLAGVVGTSMRDKIQFSFKYDPKVVDHLREVAMATIGREKDPAKQKLLREDAEKKLALIGGKRITDAELEKMFGEKVTGAKSEKKDEMPIKDPYGYGVMGLLRRAGAAGQFVGKAAERGLVTGVPADRFLGR